MKELKVCFIGYGSIAKRHIANLRKICKSRSIVLTIDVLRHKKIACNDRNVNEFVYGKLDVNDKYDIIFITNPTSLHYETLKKYHNNAKMIFMEKPLVGYSDIIKINKIKINSNKVYIACPLRYKKIIQYLKNSIDLKKAICVRAICSSYLPNWRPGTDYSKSYSAIKKLGGGVRLDLIHEWDYLQYLFGKPQKIVYCYDKFSNLKIDTEDIASYIAKYKNKLIELHVDYVGRVNERKFDIYFNDDVISVDLYNNTIDYLVANKHIKFSEDRDDYQIAELEYFLDLFYKYVKNDNNLTKAIETINMTRGMV